MKISGARGVILSTVAFILIAILFFALTFTVDEVNDAVVTRFGGQVTKVIVSKKTPELEKELHSIDKFKNVEIVEGKGLFFKAPFIDTVQKYNNRLLTYDTAPREVTTLDKKKMILDNNAQWQIVNPVFFRTSMGNERNANTRLEDIMYSKINEKIGKTEAHVLIADKANVEEMLNKVAEEVNAEVSQYGIKVVDIRIKRTDLPPENSQNIFNRMKTEREQKAKEYRSEGKEEAMNFYTSLIEDSEITNIVRYGANEGGDEGTIMQATFTLKRQEFMCIDSNIKHEFSFTPSFSIYVTCDTEDEIGNLYQRLNEDGQILMPLDNYGFSKKFCWVNDRFGVSWQLNLLK